MVNFDTLEKFQPPNFFSPSFLDEFRFFFFMKTTSLTCSTSRDVVGASVPYVAEDWSV